MFMYLFVNTLRTQPPRNILAARKNTNMSLFTPFMA